MLVENVNFMDVEFIEYSTLVCFNKYFAGNTSRNI